MTKAAIYMAAFHLVYTFLLSRDTLYGRNRAFILFAILSALILPFITIQTNNPIGFPIFGKVLSDVFVTGSKNRSLLESSAGTELTGLQIINLVYLTGVILFGLKVLINFLKLIFLIIRQKNKNTHIIVFHGLNTSGFSALGHVFINSRLTPEESEEIIRHEQNHLDHNHFFDIIFVEIVKVFQWFNPVIHMLDRSLRAVHEYQADEGCLKTGIPVVNYQRLLLNQVFRSKIFGLTNCFSNPTLIKKRMIMMTKKRSGTAANLKLLFALPVIAVLLAGFSSSTENLTTEVAPPPPPPPPPIEKNLKIGPYDVVEEMPQFPGGDAALLKYIRENTIYPASAKSQNIQGRVIIRFAITTDGTVSMASIYKGVNPDLDNEALRVVKSLPKFKPGKKGGVAVPVWYMIPISFTLK